MTRVLFYHADAAWTGGARAFAVAARGLVARGYQVGYACEADGAAHAQVAAMGLDVVELPPDAGSGTIARRLRQAIAERLVEVIFVHADDEHLAAATATRQAERGAIVRRLPAGGTLEIGRSARAVRKVPSAVLCTWPDQAAALPPDAAQLGVVTADLGVDVTAASAVTDGLPSAVGVERRLVCLYDPAARVGAAAVLRVAAMLAPRHPELRVALIGPGSDDEGLRMHAAALGVHNTVSHLGERADRTALLAAADIGWVVGGGDDAAFGALDLMAAGVPVLAEQESVAAHYVADRVTGAFISGEDVAGTAATVATLLARADTRLAMGAAGRGRARRAFGLDAMIDGFAEAAVTARDRTRWRA